MQRGWAGGWEELEETASVVMPQGLGQEEVWAKGESRRSPMMLEDLLSQACLALGTAICGPCSACALLATVLSHLLGGGRGRK